MKSNPADIGNGVSLMGGLGWVLGYFQKIDWLTLMGVLVALGGFAMNWYYNHKRNHRETMDAENRRLIALREQHRHDLEIRRMELELERLEKNDEA